ncbi:hypothetical protein MKW92_004318 [Papaver armeniacum]|nr:hypothetical protein MKW92_004318 [Papaver armeniacum]
MAAPGLRTKRKHHDSDFSSNSHSCASDSDGEACRYRKKNHNVASLEPNQLPLRIGLEASAVCSISTTNENKGVNITRSDEVPGKSSADGTAASVVAKSGNLSLAALEKAKRALQMKKQAQELAAKMGYAHGREVDEQGNVINQPKLTNLSTLKPELELDSESNPYYDQRMGINKGKLLRPKRIDFQFVEENQFGEAQAKELKIKQAQLAKSKAGPDINPNRIEVSDRVIIKEKPKDPIPELECNSIKNVEHPIEPPAKPAPPPPQSFKLTKKDQKKLSTQERLAKEKDRQEMISQGLLEPPKPKVKMATQDPTRIEMKIRSEAAEREQAHIDRNIARKLTPAEHREKRAKKRFDNPNELEKIVSVYKINDLSHSQTRCEVYAKKNRLTGCLVITEDFTVVVVEGGNKSIRRYGMLMLKKINGAETVRNEEEDSMAEDDDDKPVNKCVLVWQGFVAKSSFNSFAVHQCRTQASARKCFADAGVGHY